MKSQPLKRTAIKALACCALMWFGASAAWAAQVAGTVRQLSGPLIAKKADGKIKVLALRSEVEEGDTLVSEKNTYALIKFIDNSEITLRPDSSFKIESFTFDEGKPDGDSATFNLVKGGLRSVTGLMGKRNKEKFAMKTPTATIGIRGTTFTAQWVSPPQAGQGPGGGLPPGLHLSVIDGAIFASNNGGSQDFQAGQFGYVPSINQQPIIVPPNTNVEFVPPPSFDVAGTGPDGQDQAGDPGATDCIVR